MENRKMKTLERIFLKIKKKLKNFLIYMENGHKND